MKRQDQEMRNIKNHKAPDLVRETAAAYAARNLWHPEDDGVRPIPPSAEFPKQGRYTVGDYLALPDDRRFELIDGMLIEMEAPGRRHQLILTELLVQIHQCIRKHGVNCQVIPAPFDVRLDRDDRTVVQPDLMVICGDEQDDDRAFRGAPDLIIEILSPSNPAHDRVRKYNKYQKAGVREYWIVDPEQSQVFVYDFEKKIPEQVYSFSSGVTIRISEGRCRIDLGMFLR